MSCDGGENGVSYSIAPPLPYVGKSIRTISMPDAERFDIRLRQGVIVRGRVEDEVSKLGIPGLKLTATMLPKASTDDSPNDKSQNPKPLLDVSQSSIADNAFATTDAKGDFAIALPIGKVRLSLVSRVSGYEFVPNAGDRSDGQTRATKHEPWNVVIDTSDPARIDSQSSFHRPCFV